MLSNKKQSLDDFGALLHQTWQNKRKLSDAVSTTAIDDIYERAINAGALGGKILGAGGGGFILFYIPKKYQTKVKEELKELIYVPFQFENEGSRIVHYKPDRVNGNNKSF